MTYSADGTGSAARFGRCLTFVDRCVGPSGVAVDSGGNVLCGGRIKSQDSTGLTSPNPLSARIPRCGQIEVIASTNQLVSVLPASSAGVRPASSRGVPTPGALRPNSQPRRPRYDVKMRIAAPCAERLVMIHIFRCPMRSIFRAGRSPGDQLHVPARPRPWPPADEA